MPGNWNTLIGTIPPGDWGDGNVVIGATDERGNTILPGGFTAGFGAQGSPDGVTVGAFANGGGTRGQQALQAFIAAVQKGEGLNSQDRSRLAQNLDALASQKQLPTPQRDRGKIRAALEDITTVATAITTLGALWAIAQPYLQFSLH